MAAHRFASAAASASLARDLWTLLEQKAIIVEYVRACHKYLFRDLSMIVSISSSKASFSFHPNPPRTTYSNCFLHRRQANYHQLSEFAFLVKSIFIENEIPVPLGHVIADQEAFEDVANRLHPLLSAAETIYTAAKT